MTYFSQRGYNKATSLSFTPQYNVIHIFHMFLRQMISYITCYNISKNYISKSFNFGSVAVSTIQSLKFFVTLVSKLFPLNKSSYLMNLLLNINGTSSISEKNVLPQPPEKKIKDCCLDLICPEQCSGGSANATFLAKE